MNIENVDSTRWSGHAKGANDPLPSSTDRCHNVKMAFTFLDERWLPKSVLCLRDYNRHKFLLDLIAGVTVGLVALPLAMAFAIASGLTPQAGIYCAIVTGFLISALGGSKTQIGGPLVPSWWSSPALSRFTGSMASSCVR